jgi:hypothetical protein
MMSIVSTITVAADVRRRVLRSRNRFWRPEDFDGSPEAVAKALSRLTRSGELRRVRRGLYWRGAKTRLGMAPPPTERLIEEVVDEAGVGPASLSAALALGLTTQVPRIETIAVPGRAPRDARGVEFVSRNASRRRRSEHLRPVEVALLETLRDWESLVEIPLADALDRIETLATEGAVRVDRVVRAAPTEPPRVRERLRKILTALNRPEDAKRVPGARSELARQDLALGL